MTRLALAFVAGALLTQLAQPTHAFADMTSVAERIARALDRMNTLTERGCK